VNANSPKSVKLGVTAIAFWLWRVSYTALSLRIQCAGRLEAIQFRVIHSLFRDSIKRQVQFQYVDTWLAEETPLPSLRVRGHQSAHLFFSKPRGFGDSRNLETLRRPECKCVGLEAGRRKSLPYRLGTGLPGFSAWAVATSAFTRSISVWFVGPRFDPEELLAS